MMSLNEIRASAMALPEVTEGPPAPAARRISAFKVAGKSFLGVETGGSRLTISLSEAEAKEIVAGGKGGYQEIRRGAKILGLRVDLAVVSPEQVRQLIERSWRFAAPPKVVAAFEVARNG